MSSFALVSKNKIEKAPVFPALSTKTVIQPKLEIGQPDDQYEKEANAVADKVMRMPVQPERDADGGVLQMKCKEPAFAKATADEISFSRKLEGSKGMGRMLPNDRQQEFGAKMNADFSGVKIHTDQNAEHLSREIGAKAFTNGKDIYFNNGEYNPDSSAGKHLLAHELTHVVQQGALKGGSSDSQFLSREPSESAPSVEERLAIVEKKQTATLLDLKWRAIFGRQLSSYRQAVWRISGGLENAKKNFTTAGIEQAEFDTMVLQLIIASAAIGVAAGFQPLFGLAFASVVGDKIDDLIELLENPIVQIVGSSADIVGPAGDVYESSKPSTSRESELGGPTGSNDNALGSLTGSPMEYLSTNMQIIEKYNGRVEAAFEKRAMTLLSPTEKQIENFDQARREARYSQILEEMQNACQGIEIMKTPEEVAIILERHLWGIWIRQRNYRTERSYSNKTGQQIVRGTPGLGAYIAEALVNVGLGSSILPQVQLGTNWYTPHEPENWADLIRRWAETYRETITLL